MCQHPGEHQRESVPLSGHSSPPRPLVPRILTPACAILAPGGHGSALEDCWQHSHTPSRRSPVPTANT